MEKQTELLTLGRLARQVAVNPETIRFYERSGLIRPDRRLASGYRIFSHESARRVCFIKRAQQLGFSLAEIKELLSLRQGRTGRECEAVKKLAKDKIGEIDGKIATLKQMRTILKRLERQCPGSGPLNGCPIVGCLNKNEATVHGRRRGGRND